MDGFILLGLPLAISSAIISLQANFWKNRLADLRLNSLHCGYVMRESGIYEPKLPCSCLPGSLFGRAHLPLTSQRSKEEKNHPAILWKKHLWQPQPCAESEATWRWEWDTEICTWQSEETASCLPTLVCCCACKAGREASSRTGSLVIQRFLCWQGSFFNLCHQGSYDQFFLVNLNN